MCNCVLESSVCNRVLESTVCNCVVESTVCNVLGHASTVFARLYEHAVH